MDEQYDLYKLAFNYIPGIGAVTAKILISYCGGIEAVFKASKKSLLAIPGIGEKKAHDILNNEALSKAEAELKAISGRGVKLRFYLDDDYPTRLKNYDDCPILLYCKGNIQAEAKRMVAIVGTRKITPYGQIQCANLVEGLKEYDCTVVSGLAYGVDTYAHRTAVELGMPTIGILGNGLNKIYPPANHKLAEKMLDKGGVISEFQMDQKPDRENFPSRNRIIVGMSDVIIVVESARSGGSMISAEYGNNYNKDVFAVPGRSSDPMSEGCNHLIKAHKAHLCTSADDIAYIMRWDKEAPSNQMQLFVDLTPEEKIIVDLIREIPNIGLDTLHYKTKLPLGQVTTILLNIEFKGVIKSLPGKKYILAR